MEQTIEMAMEKALFIGAAAGVFFISVDEHIYENFTNLADMMDVFIEKTKGEAPFLVYGVIEDKEKVAKLKTNKELMKHLGDVKKWTSQHGGEFRLENLSEIKVNLRYLITEYSHYILTKLRSKTNYANLQLGEVHYLDYDDLNALKEIEEALAEQLKAGESVDQLLSELFFKYLKMEKFKEETFELPPEEITEIGKLPPSKIKIILEEIRRGIRRQCPGCFNMERNKIREVIDKENVIYNYGTDIIYGFKYVCGMCGKEWRTQRDKVVYEVEKE